MTQHLSHSQLIPGMVAKRSRTFPVHSDRETLILSFAVDASLEFSSEPCPTLPNYEWVSSLSVASSQSPWSDAGSCRWAASVSPHSIHSWFAGTRSLPLCSSCSPRQTPAPLLGSWCPRESPLCPLSCVGRVTGCSTIIATISSNYWRLNENLWESQLESSGFWRENSAATSQGRITRGWQD